MSDDEKEAKLEEGKKSKRGRQMTPEMLEKLAASQGGVKKMPRFVVSKLSSNRARANPSSLPDAR